MLPRSQRRALPPGFTLLEMLVSIAIIAILVTLATLSILSSLASQQLGATAFRFAGDVTQASQLAATENRTIALTFLEEQSSLAEPEDALQILGWQFEATNPESGALEPISDPVRLETGILIMDDEKYSTLLNRPRSPGEARRIRFKADGSTDLPPGNQQRWCITFAIESDLQKDPGNLPPNSRTVVINAFTAAVTVY